MAETWLREHLLPEVSWVQLWAFLYQRALPAPSLPASVAVCSSLEDLGPPQRLGSFYSAYPAHPAEASCEDPHFSSVIATA